MNISFFNRAAEVITGYSFSEVQGRMIGEVFPGLLQAAAGADANGSGDDVPRARFEISFRRNDGRQVYLGFSKSTLKDGDREQQGEVYAFQDVTRLKEMEEQVKIMDRLAAVGRLASGMAHEIRNPLASMSGSIQILGQSLQLDDDNKRLMDIVLKETNRLDQLLSDFVLFTHPDQRKKKQIELNAVIMDAIELFLSNPDHHLITVMTDLNGSIMLEADPHQIKQVLWNLFVNAHQAMSLGGKLTITSKKVAAPDLKELRQKLPGGAEVPFWVQLTVADTGCGIEESDVDKVFDPFFTTKPRGSGLGLAIVYSIVESYKGHVSLKSQKDRGAIFTILLPAA
jgi:two-component system sensor histidine kinase PilS (NtrC family)